MSIVGLVLASLNISPLDIYDWVRRAIWRIYDMGFAAFVDAFAAGYVVDDFLRIEQNGHRVGGYLLIRKSE